MHLDGCEHKHVPQI